MYPQLFSIIDIILFETSKTFMVSRFFLFQESLSISAAASEIDKAAPTLIVKESFEGEVSEVFLVSEKVVLCKIDPPKSPLFLFVAFYAFNRLYADYR